MVLEQELQLISGTRQQLQVGVRHAPVTQGRSHLLQLHLLCSLGINLEVNLLHGECLVP